MQFKVISGHLFDSRYVEGCRCPRGSVIIKVKLLNAILITVLVYGSICEIPEKQLFLHFFSHLSCI